MGDCVSQLIIAVLPHLPPGPGEGGPHKVGGPGQTPGVGPLLGLGGLGQYTTPARLHVMDGVFAGAVRPQLPHIPAGPAGRYVFIPV